MGASAAGAKFRSHPPGSGARSYGWKGSIFMSVLLIVLLVLLLVGALPMWPYSTGWGYYPGSGLGLVLLIIVILAITGHI